MNHADHVLPVSSDVSGIEDSRVESVPGYRVANGMHSQVFDDEDPALIDENILSSVKKACLALLDGSETERLLVLSHMSEFLTHWPEETVQEMVPEIACYAVTWRNNLKQAAAEALYTAASVDVPGASARVVVVAAICIVDNANDESMAAVWGEILASYIPHMTREDVDSDVKPVMLRSSSSMSPESRRLAGLLLKCLGRMFPEEELELQLLDLTLRLCDDEDSNVRAVAADALSSIGVKLSVSVAEVRIWPKLCGLLEDTAARVHANALRAIARIAEVHKQHSISCLPYQTRLLPVFLKECSSATAAAESDLRFIDEDMYMVLEAFAEVYGYFLCAVQVVLSGQESWNIALNALRRMVVCNGPAVRQWCAYHLPAVASVCHSTRPEKLAQVVLALANDTDIDTRVTLALGLHETIRQLGSGYMRDEVFSATRKLINDESDDVRKAIFLRLEAILTLAAHNTPSLFRSSNMAPDSEYLANPDGDKVVPSEYLSGETQLSMLIKELPSVCRDHWRTQDIMARQIELSAHVIPYELLCDHVVPIMFRLARESTPPVRKSSMSAIVRIIRYIPNVERRDHVIDHLHSEWASGNLHWTRLAFVDAAETALQRFSSKLFRQLFSEALLHLACDPVDNVRLRLALVLPSIARKCGSFGAIENALEFLKKDSDPDIVQSISLTQRVLLDGIVDVEANVRQEEEELRFFMSLAPISVVTDDVPTDDVPTAASGGAGKPNTAHNSAPSSVSGSAKAEASPPVTNTNDSGSARQEIGSNLNTSVPQTPAQIFAPDYLVHTTEKMAVNEAEGHHDTTGPRVTRGGYKGRRFLAAGRFFSGGAPSRARTQAKEAEKRSCAEASTPISAQNAQARPPQQGLDRTTNRKAVPKGNRIGDGSGP